MAVDPGCGHARSRKPAPRGSQWGRGARPGWAARGGQRRARRTRRCAQGRPQPAPPPPGSDPRAADPRRVRCSLPPHPGRGRDPVPPSRKPKSLWPSLLVAGRQCRAGSWRRGHRDSLSALPTGLHAATNACASLSHCSSSASVWTISS